MIAALLEEGLAGNNRYATPLIAVEYAMAYKHKPPQPGSDSTTGLAGQSNS